MDLFSSNAEDTINKRISCSYDESSVVTEEDLENVFSLQKCVAFIQKHGFTKVCLQFPDNLLQFAVRVALWLEKSITQKVFVLGDTTYGSCCVDELAVQHIEGDAVIHFGHACLSPTSRLPVMYVLPRAPLDLDKFTPAFTQHCNSSEEPVLLLYDVAFGYLIDEISAQLSHLKKKVVISQLIVPGYQTVRCCENCSLDEGSLSHSVLLLGRTYCCKSVTSVVYIAYRQSQNMLNFALTFRDAKFYTYTGGDITTVDFNKTLRRRLYLVEKVKDAKTLGILVGTLSIDGYLGAIERIKKLAAFRGKRSYIFSVGKPNPAKLANFPEIEVYVMISCPEACLENVKEFMQPVVTLLEAELALSPSCDWDDKLSVDFRDLVKSAPPLPEGQEPLEADVSLIVNRIRSDVVVADSESATNKTALTIKDQYQISVASSYSAGRSWRGLEQALGETPVAQAKIGRSGIPLAYEEEKAHQKS